MSNECNHKFCEHTEDCRCAIDAIHYQGKGLKAIEVIEAFELNFSLGNAIKYILRSGKKGNAKEDLEKAIWYLKREVDKPIWE